MAGGGVAARLLKRSQELCVLNLVKQWKQTENIKGGSWTWPVEKQRKVTKKRYWQHHGVLPPLVPLAI